MISCERKKRISYDIINILINAFYRIITMFYFYFKLKKIIRIFLYFFTHTLSPCFMYEVHNTVSRQSM